MAHVEKQTPSLPAEVFLFNLGHPNLHPAGCHVGTILSGFIRTFDIFLKALPIGSMYGIYGNMYHQYTPVMLAYIPYMDPMG